MESEQTILWVVSIIAIVGIVGMIVATTRTAIPVSVSPGVSPSSNVVGNARYMPSPSCYWTTQCSYNRYPAYNWTNGTNSTQNCTRVWVCDGLA